MDVSKSIDESGFLRLRDGAVEYSSDVLGAWSVEIDRIKVIGEMTTEEGPFADDYFLVLVTGPDDWYLASSYARGRDEVVSALREHLHADLEFTLTGSTDLTSRVLWPEALRGRDLLVFRDDSPGGVWDRIRQLWSPRKVAMSLTDEVRRTCSGTSDGAVG
ncbi:MAG: hypothetical protein WDZ59_02270 [Pirellulales bacterium]